MLTLTSHEKLSPARSVEVLGHAWNSLNRRLSRQGKPEYLLAPEQHRSGKLHVHLLTTAHLPKKWWKDTARSVGLGYQAEVEPISDPGKAADYVLKYVTKSLETQMWPKGFWRVRTSRGWPTPPIQGFFEGWEFEHLPQRFEPNLAIEQMRSPGFFVASMPGQGGKCP